MDSSKGPVLLRRTSISNIMRQSLSQALSSSASGGAKPLETLRSSELPSMGKSVSGGDQDYEAHLMAVAQEMFEKVEVKDRSHHFKTHKSCFVGKDAVKFLVWSGRASSVAEALSLGNALMQRGIFSHVTNDHSFKNENLFYRFNADSLAKKGLASTVRAAGGNSSSSLDSAGYSHSQASVTLEGMKQYALDPPDVIESKLAAVAQQMQKNMPVRDHFWHLKTHKSCFHGREAVKWLQEHGHASNDGEAVAVGNALLKRCSITTVLGGEAAFSNDDTLFRFRIHDDLYLSGVAWLASAGLSASMEQVVRDMLLRVDVRDWPGRLTPHKSSFSGKDAVSCLLATGHAKAVEEAVTLGNALHNQRVFVSVSGDYPFRNDGLLYRFAAHDDSWPAADAGLARSNSVESLRRRGWGASRPGERLSDEEFESRIHAVCDAMLQNVEAKDHTRHLKVYKRCFEGKAGVKLLLERGFATSIAEAVSVGNALMKRGVVSAVAGGHPFRNDEALFRFKMHDEDVRKGLHWLSKSRGLDASMEGAARAMLAKLPIKDHSLKFRRYRKCFVGREAVQFLIQQGFADSADAALSLGNAMMEKDVFTNVNGDHAFENSAKLFYRFNAHEDDTRQQSSVPRWLKRDGRAGAAAAKRPRHDPSARAVAGALRPGNEWGSGSAASEFYGAAGLQMAPNGWRTIMHGLDELNLGTVGLDPVLGAIELVGQESVASGLLHWGMTKVVLVLTFVEDCVRSGQPLEPAVAKADELLGKAGRRINEALQYKSDCYQAAMMIAVIHHMRAVMHCGLLNLKETMAYFNVCLASGGALALDSGEGAAMLSLSTALEDAEDDPLNNFLATQGAQLAARRNQLQAEKVVAADVHFQSAKRIMQRLVRLLPAEERQLSRGREAAHSDDEELLDERKRERGVFEMVCDMWGLLLWEQSQLWAAVGRPWKPLLDQAVDRLREGGALEADIDLLISCHLMMQQPTQ